MGKTHKISIINILYKITLLLLDRYGFRTLSGCVAASFWSSLCWPPPPTASSAPFVFTPAVTPYRQARLVGHTSTIFIERVNPFWM